MAPLRVKVVAGLQWAITGGYVFLLGFLLAVWYFHLTRTAISLDLSVPFAVFVASAFAVGYLRVGARASTASPDAHDQRIEVVLTMLVLGFVLPFGVPGALDLLGVELGVPLAGFGVAYALTLALSYGLVYGLGLRFFLGPTRPDLRE
ncbi:hypothetical protein [Halorussus lipolyticus]|uniref:hypothetical protein n=1 Tax=Halorussus lipolyticus TaxID=3034024 RepID=UPI0023E83CA3|nr:hypothetical protein [Halorussus sp. DT80]